MPSATKITKSKYSLLPTRMSIHQNSLDNWQVLVLDFPIKQELLDFQNTICRILVKSKLEYDEQPPFRRLNNLLLSLTSTIIHGFEFYTDIERVVAIKPKFEITDLPDCPEPARIFEVLQSWLKEWVTTKFNSFIETDGAGAWQKLLKALEQAIIDKNWRVIEPRTLLADLDSQNSLGYQAISSILATILHNRTSIIESNWGRRVIEWRKATNSGRQGLFVLSKPFKTTYVPDKKSLEDKPKEKVGYFAYKIEFLVQNQAGRFYQDNHKLKPWIFIRVGIQRYAHLPVTPNFGRKISFMVRLNRERLDGFKVDSTLVQLEAEYNRVTRKFEWVSGLPELIEQHTVARLANPQAILDNPEAYANFAGELDFAENEYYIVHAEGFKQQPKKTKPKQETSNDQQKEPKGLGLKHAVLTGNSFIERRKTIASILEYFKAILEPDVPMLGDEAGAITDSKKKEALRDFGDISKGCVSLEASFLDKKNAQKRGKEPDITKRREKRTLVQADLVRALQQTTQGKPIQLNVIWHNLSTRLQIEQRLRDVLLLNEQDQIPSNVQVNYFQAEANLLAPLVGDRFDKDTVKLKEIRVEVAKAHGTRVDLWRKFLDQNLPKGETTCYKLALVEIPRLNLKKYYVIQGIKGVVRDACARSGLSSQMLNPVRIADKNGQSVIVRKSETESRILSALREVLYRHTGALFGSPTDLFQKAGFPAAIAGKLDIIAFCRLESFNLDIHYGLAVRLRATGEMDVLLPQHGEWLPYITAATVLGKIFAHERGKSKRYLANRDNPLKLKNSQLAHFVAQVLTQRLEHPTVALIEAERWRDGKEGNKTWPQLKNDNLAAQQAELDFRHLLGFAQSYTHADKITQNLLGIIRIRQGNESPQYVAHCANWQDKIKTQDFHHLTGFLDESIPDLLHYFSVGKLPKTQKRQIGVKLYDKLKYESEGAATSYKHQQMLELVPFFVRPDFQERERKLALCRIAHFLRVNPAWGMGNTVLPYPMHLGETLIRDQLCILRLEE